MKKRFLYALMVCFLIIGISVPIFSHSGNTDSYGGHYNVDSGTYHYHHGKPEHNHYNGVCPYESDSEEEVTEITESQITVWNILGTIGLVVLIIAAVAASPLREPLGMVFLFLLQLILAISYLVGSGIKKIVIGIKNIICSFIVCIKKHILSCLLILSVILLLAPLLIGSFVYVSDFISPYISGFPMSITINANLLRNGSKGNQWEFTYKVNDIKIENDSLEIKLYAWNDVCVTTNFIEWCSAEKDMVKSILQNNFALTGIASQENSKSLTVSDLKNGFRIRQIVCDGGDEWSGNVAVWEVYYTFEPINK